jgi:hypothetical protein
MSYLTEYYCSVIPLTPTLSRKEREIRMIFILGGDQGS